MKSIMDFQTTNSFSKYFRIGFENDLFNEELELNPLVELGLMKSLICIWDIKFLKIMMFL